ncbi:Ser/Thr protein phosphatase, putative [Trichomonas vaginalis G3]|uniref:Serine/threonine-protein phosphatase n=1 Tax=Trichomonas vaginalis (strain ATCC PRA-98 / G3) TaxID=412133 RepID=A2EQH7_TRIV3|nr:phosphoprotein phosphatase protein [Trichomonas vaginalis G3]EAY05119.1 Ser/Thr protein phosphatase, putative [Trichomonas vaginalis G3]KAI5551454.1 phosphoprotein phosphatase protein [Trichomonas vaginalis G3]|eukprot:XP_001317342.1 Ser/Thr protein phosphatase [Trichomonas vaginalis G3]
MNGSVEYVLHLYSPFFHATNDELNFVGTKMPVPRLNPEVIRDIIVSAQEHFKNQPNVLNLELPMYVVGDIHGNLKDLLRIISPHLMNSNAKFLFLGDYVDRGSFSLEVVTLLYALVLKFPNRFFLIRGNHEVTGVSKVNGLYSDCLFSYNAIDLVAPIYESFSYLPLAAIIGGNILCIHGGLGPSFNYIDQLKHYQRPITELTDEVLSDLLWSDPNTMASTYLESPRGKGKLFGTIAINQFLKDNNIRYIIRGHQCVEHGVEFFNENIFTIFSSSFYNDENENKAGYLFLSEHGHHHSIILEPFHHTSRINANFQDYMNLSIRKPKSYIGETSSAYKNQFAAMSIVVKKPNTYMIGKRRTVAPSSAKVRK